MGRNKFKSIEEFNSELMLGNEFEIAYAGGNYHIECCSSKDSIEKFWVTNLNNEVAVNYDTFDEMLDNFKVDGKSLREFILKAVIDGSAVTVGDLTEYANWKRDTSEKIPD
jgi:hypothetical protein